MVNLDDMLLLLILFSFCQSLHCLIRTIRYRSFLELLKNIGLGPVLNSKLEFMFFHFCRILKMMHVISSHSRENRMTFSAVAACMAPLLLRPLLAGECELDDDFDINGDNSAQLLAAANAANNAQAIISTLLEEYENIFDVRLCGTYVSCFVMSFPSAQVPLF